MKQTVLSITMTFGAPKGSSIFSVMHISTQSAVVRSVAATIGQRMRCSKQTRRSLILAGDSRKDPAKSMKDTSRRPLMGTDITTL